MRRRAAWFAIEFPLHPGAVEIMPGFNDPLEEFSPYA
jgi:hypothetical protein